MRNLRIFICVIALVLFSTSPLFAGNAENKDGWSAEWVRTLNRNASTDSADAVVYNPAGVLRLENGNYINLSVIHGRPDFSHTVGGTVYENDTANSPPGFHALIKQDKWAAFASVTITAGGGDAEYANGSNTTNTLGLAYLAPTNTVLGTSYDNISQQRLTAESLHRSFTIGGAYRLNKEVSLSVGTRYIDATKETDGSITFNDSGGADPDLSRLVAYDETADGWGGIIGINYVPREDLNIGMRYETKTTLDFQTKERADELVGGVVTDGAKARRDLPGVIGLGAAYQVSPKLKAETGFTYFLNKSADWADSALTTTADESKADNGFNLGIALEYAFRTKLKGSLGYQYMNTGIDPDNMTLEDPQLDAHLLAGGFAYKVMPDMNLNLGLARVFYKDETTSTGVKLDKKLLLIALGIQYEFK